MATVNMALTLPTVGGSTDTWGTELNTALTAIDAHDHSSGNGAQVPAAGLGIDGDVAWGDNSITGLKAARFTSQAVAITSHTLGLAVSSNELYWVTSGGTAVQLTSGASLNTTLVGGFTGDYSTTDAECEYSDSAKSYKFLRDASPADLTADIECGDVWMYERGAYSDYIRHRLVSPTASKTILWPAGALPSDDDSVMMIDSSGQISWPAAASMPHGDKTETYGVFAARFTSGSLSGGGTSVSYWTSAGTDTCTIDIVLPVGCRIKSFSMFVRENSANTIDLKCYKQTLTSSWGMTQIGTTATSSGAGAMAIEKVTHTLGTPETIAADTKYTLHALTAATSLDVAGFAVTYDRT